MDSEGFQWKWSKKNSELDRFSTVSLKDGESKKLMHGKHEKDSSKHFKNYISSM